MSDFDEVRPPWKVEQDAWRDAARGVWFWKSTNLIRDARTLVHRVSVDGGAYRKDQKPADKPTCSQAEAIAGLRMHPLWDKLAVAGRTHRWAVRRLRQRRAP